MVHSSKTTRVTTLVQENFFVCWKNKHNATKIKLLSDGRFFVKLTWPRKVRPRADQTVGNIKILIDIDAGHPKQDFGEEKSGIFQVLFEICQICKVGLHFIFHWMEVARPVSSSSPWFEVKDEMSLYCYSRFLLTLHSSVTFLLFCKFWSS